MQTSEGVPPWEALEPPGPFGRAAVGAEMIGSRERLYLG
jgi:hypothetical protein